MHPPKQSLNEAREFPLSSFNSPWCETADEQPHCELKLTLKDFQGEKQLRCLYQNTAGTKARSGKIAKIQSFYRLFSYRYGTSSGIFVNIEMCCDVSTVSARERCCIWLKNLLHLWVQCTQQTATHLQKSLHHYCTCRYWKAVWDQFYFVSGNAPSQAQL